jgi:rubrerythrin
MIISINTSCLFLSILAAGFFAGCSSTTPPSLPAGNAADPQARVSANLPNNLLAHDQTTVAIHEELSRTESNAKSAESMHHDMNNMPGMQHGDMEGMQHEGMKMEDHKDIPQQTNVDAEKKTVADEMKKTSEEMKKTSEEMKKNSQQTNPQNFYYTCRMHPQIHSDKPGKCPICGMTLIKKEGAPPK